MKQAQTSIFIIVGLVLVISVAAVIAIANSARTPPPDPEIRPADTLHANCLETATDRALGLLQEHAAISEQAPKYLLAERNNFPLGVNNYTGLCTTNGPNPAGTPQQCPPNTYARPGTPSVQDQLTSFISQELEKCADAQEQVEIIFQTDNLIVRSSEAQYTSQAPLTSVWAAINEFLRKEVTTTTYYTGEPKTIQACNGCHEVTVEQTRQTPNTKEYTFSVNEDAVATIHAENRGVAYINPATNRVHRTPQEFACPGNPDATCAVAYSIDLDLLDWHNIIGVWDGRPGHYLLNTAEPQEEVED